jgi:hypothetical protein
VHQAGQEFDDDIRVGDLVQTRNSIFAGNITNISEILNDNLRIRGYCTTVRRPVIKDVQHSDAVRRGKIVRWKGASAVLRVNAKSPKCGDPGVVIQR